MLAAVAVFKLTAVGVGLYAAARKRRKVVARLRALYFTKNFLERLLPNALLGFGRNANFAIFGFGANVAFVLQISQKIADAILVVGQVVLLIELREPAQSLGYIARGIGEYFQKNLQQSLKIRLVCVVLGNVFRKIKSYHGYLFLCGEVSKNVLE